MFHKTLYSILCCNCSLNSCIFQILDLSPEREACINYRIGRIPPGIGNLTGLRVLMLDTNELDVLPSEICLLTLLEKVTLSNNYLRKLPDGFNQLQRLDTLYLANNRFDKVGNR